MEGLQQPKRWQLRMFPMYHWRGTVHNDTGHKRLWALILFTDRVVANLIPNVRSSPFM